MRLIVVEPLGSDAAVREQRFYFDSKKLPLKVFLSPLGENVDAVSINGVFEESWREYVAADLDVVTVFPRVGVAAGAFVPLLISLLVNLAITLLTILLAPSPKTPKSGFQPSMAVPGLTNTISPGSPKLMVFGTRRIFPGVIGSQARIMPGSRSRRMEFRALYFAGVGPIGGISDVELDGVDYLDIPDVRATSRLGEPDQTVIPGWEHCHQIYYDGRAIARGDPTSSAGEPIFWTTRSLKIDRVTFFLNFPSGHFGTRESGSRAGTPHDGHSEIRIRFKRHDQDETAWADITASIDGGPLQTSPFFMVDRKRNGFFREIVFDLPEAIRGFWDFEYTMLQVRPSQTSGDPIMLNVQETLFFTTNYEGSALLEVRGIGSEQINSLENLKTSCLTCGILIEKPEPLTLSPAELLFQCCGPGSKIDFQVSGNYTAPLTWETTKGDLIVAPGNESAELRPVTSGVSGSAYGKAACFVVGTLCTRQAGNEHYGCDDQTTDTCTGVGTDECLSAAGASCGSFGCGVNPDIQFKVAPCDVPSCDPFPLFSDSCVGVRSLGHICDLRSPEMISQGCEPCIFQFQEGAVVTVRDAAGQFASAVISGSKATECEEFAPDA